MMQNCNKMEESSMQQQNAIIVLEQTYQELVEHVANHIKFGKEKNFNCPNPILERLV